jgi:hypothetical protein
MRRGWASRIVLQRGSLLGPLLLMPFVAFLYVTYAAPRPFHAAEDDPEHNTYYNARLLSAGQPIYQLAHPGTPVYYGAFLIMTVVGHAPDRVQHFFTICRLLWSVLTAFSLGFFGWLCLRRLPVGVSALAVSLLLTWPSFLLYIDYFDPNCLTVAFGLPTIALFWSGLRDDGGLSFWGLLACGLGLGLCLATKLTFLPVAFAMIVTVVLRTWRSSSPDPRACARLLSMPIGMALSFACLNAPILGRLPILIINTIEHPEAAVGRDALQALLRAWTALQDASLLLAIVTLVTAGAFVWVTLIRSGDPTPASRESTLAEVRMDTGRLDLTGAGVFLSLMLCGMVYTMAGAGGIVEPAPPGHTLRNVHPTALALPFVVIYIYERSRRRWMLGRVWGRVASAALVLTAGLVVVSAVGTRIEGREAFIQAHATLAEQTQKRLETLREPNTRVAVWDGSPGSLMGPPSFHFWGNYWYAHDYFDRELAETYPHFVFFRLREVPNLIRGRQDSLEPAGADTSAVPATPDSWFGWAARRIGRRAWRRTFPEPYGPRTDEVVANEWSGERVSILAFPEDEEVAELRGWGITESDFLSFVQGRFGTPILWRESIGGVAWVLVRFRG